jgi:hypothetical protein
MPWTILGISGDLRASIFLDTRHLATKPRLYVDMEVCSFTYAYIQETPDASV